MTINVLPANGSYEDILCQETLCQQIVDNAMLATGSRYVHMALLENEGQASRIVAWNHTPARAWKWAQDLVEDFSPGFVPSQVIVEVDPDKGFGREYYSEKPITGPLEELAAGIVDPRIVRIASTVGGVHHVFASALRTKEKIVGSMVFGSARPLSAYRLRICEAVVRQAALTIERAAQLHTLGEQLQELERFKAQVLAEEEAAQRTRENTPVLEFGSLQLDQATLQVSQDEALLHLTPTEYELLAVFMRQPGHAFSRGELAQRVWGNPTAQSSNFMDVAVAGLRKKIEAGGRPRIIQTVRGHGYALRSE